MHTVDGFAFVTYETHFAPCGGIAAVMKFLPDAFRAASSLRTIVLTPFHHQLPKMKAISDTKQLRGVVSVLLGGRPVQVHLFQLDIPNSSVEWYAFLPDDPRFFSGKRHPYDMDSSDWKDANLLHDTMLFGVAVSKGLHLLGPGLRWSVMMQDWEGATAALALAGQPHPHQLYLTLHNSYDSGMLHDSVVSGVGIEPSDCQGPRPHATILERALPLIKKPVFTVSEGFAHDLLEDPFQRDVMFPHLQEKLGGASRLGISGIDNGPFSSLGVPDELLSDVPVPSHSGFSSTVPNDPLFLWKEEKRKDFRGALEVLHADATDPKRGGLPQRVYWGDIKAFLNFQDTQEPQIPWFVMGGRDDSRQKGYDVATQAIRQCLNEKREACFLFFPIPGDEGLAGLRFLADLAREFPQRVLVFPFVFREGYIAALQGSTYAMMPSFYEPFGAANEFYLNGTVGIGRATGGLVQQIVPLRSFSVGDQSSSYTHAVAHRSDKWHSQDSPPTGLLFREPDELPRILEDWHAINAAQYHIHGGDPDRMEQRRNLGVWQEMVNALQGALVEGLDLYEKEPALYAQLLRNGIRHIQSSFSWKQTAGKYLAHISPAS